MQEFFIPAKFFSQWLNHLKVTFNRKFKYVTLLNITIRYVYKDKVTFLNYAKDDMYAFVFYYRLPNRLLADKELQMVNQLLLNKAIELGGTFYLPYRHHYEDHQLKICYPEISDFFSLKKMYDPNKLFSNLWYEKFDNNL